MKPPIVVYNWGDGFAYSSIDEAERHLEAIDVQNGEYLGFDSEGRILEIGVVPNTDKVRIQSVTPDSSFSPQLKYILLHWLRYFKVPENDLKHADLAGLVEMVRTHGRK